VAIKCIKPELAANPVVIQRAQREASVQLDHSNLIRMYGFFSGAEFNQYTGTYIPTYYIAMERLLGVNLDEILFKGVVSDRSGMVIPLAQELKDSYDQDKVRASLGMMLPILSGVEHLHNCGFVHRDLDPSNVMITQEGNVKLIDFGICKRLGITNVGNSGLTQAGQFLGKVAYAAPELILGDVNSQGPATDIYALGIILFQLAMGYLPVEGTDQQVMDAHLKGNLNLSAVTDKRLRKIIEKATAKDPNKRYVSAREFSSDISAMLEGSTMSYHPASSSSEAKKEVNVPNSIIPICSAAGLIVGIILSFIIR